MSFQFHNCEQCGKEFRGCVRKKQSCRFCSKSCYGITRREFYRKMKVADTGWRAVSDGMFRWISAWKTCSVCKCTWTSSSRHDCDRCRNATPLTPVQIYGVGYCVPIHCKCRRCGNLFRNTGKRRTCDSCIVRLKREGKSRTNHRRRIRKTMNDYAEQGKVDTFEREGVIRSDQWICYLCGRKTSMESGSRDGSYPTVDHVVPIARGGSNDRSNLRCACMRCNSKKSDMTIGEFMGSGRWTYAG